MADFWDELNGGAGSLPKTGGNDPAAISAYFQQKAGRAPTDQELAAYTNGTPNWQQQIDANVAAPGGYSNLLNFGNVNGTPASGSDFGAVPAPFAPPSGSDSFTPQQLMNRQFTDAAPTFAAPTDVTMQNDPGYAFRIQQVQQAGERAAAAKGTVLTGGTQSAIAQRVGDQASAEFNNVFGRANQTFANNLATYGAKYNVFSGNADRENASIAGNNAARSAATQQNFNNAGATYGVNAAVTKGAQDDYWSRLMDQARLGAQSAAA